MATLLAMNVISIFVCEYTAQLNYSFTNKLHMKAYPIRLQRLGSRAHNLL